MILRKDGLIIAKCDICKNEKHVKSKDELDGWSKVYRLPNDHRAELEIVVSSVIVCDKCTKKLEESECPNPCLYRFEKLGHVLSFLVICLFLSSCATLIKDKNQNLTITSNLESAYVWVDGENKCQTPCQIVVDGRKDKKIAVVKNGKTVWCKIKSQASIGYIIIDILLGLIPAVIDGATGNWNTLDSNQCRVEL